MQCPYCGSDSRVLDSRGASDVVRRRRQCLECERRFTTYERLANPEIKVQKRNGAQEPFDRGKLERVLAKLSRGRPTSEKAREDLARGLEAELIDAGVQVVTSGQVADRLLVRLGELDRIAAQRFAMNYQGEDGQIHTAFGRPSPQLALLFDPGAVVEEIPPPAPVPEPPKLRPRARARKP